LGKAENCVAGNCFNTDLKSSKWKKQQTRLCNFTCSLGTLLSFWYLLLSSVSMVESTTKMIFGNNSGKTKYGGLMANVDKLTTRLDPNDYNFALFMEFINFMNSKLVDIKDKSTGKNHKVLSDEAKFIFGDAHSQKMYQLLNKLVAYYESA